MRYRVEALVELEVEADELRSLTDEELARMLVQGNACEPFCRNEARCGAALISDEEIPEEWCVGCALLWLREVE